MTEEQFDNHAKDETTLECALTSTSSLENVKEQPDSQTLDDVLPNDNYVPEEDVAKNFTDDQTGDGVSREEITSPVSERVDGRKKNPSTKITPKDMYREQRERARKNPVEIKLTLKGTMKGLWYMMRNR